MKTKILLLIIIPISICFAQSGDITELEESGWIGLTKADLDIAYIHFEELDIFSLIIRYEQECYTDSSYSEGWEYVISDERMEGIPMMGHWKVIIKHRVYIEKWTHREPTFKGFIEFIKRKVGQ